MICEQTDGAAVEAWSLSENDTDIGWIILAARGLCNWMLTKTRPLI